MWGECRGNRESEHMSQKSLNDSHELDNHELKVQESLSALMDNEADDLELRRILKSCEQQPELMATWERYHLARSILHGNARPVSPSLSQRIAAEIAAESAPTLVTTAANTRWQQVFGKVAIAASVALVFIVAVQSNFSSDSTPTLVQQDQFVPAPDTSEAPLSLLAADATTPVVLDPAAQQRLREYLESVTFDEEKPVITVHIQDSPLYRLVNELGTQPQ